MKRILRNPIVNAVCISIFTAFYALVLLTASGRAGFKSLLYYSGAGQGAGGFWARWSAFLASGHLCYIALAVIALTVVVVALLLLRRRPYDEYHTSLLSQCLAVALVLTLGRHRHFLSDDTGRPQRHRGEVHALYRDPLVHRGALRPGLRAAVPVEIAREDRTDTAAHEQTPHGYRP